MKFNLKNRPTFSEDHEWYEGIENDMQEWFEGFEKELREMVEEDKRSQLMPETMILLKEILGE